MTTEQNPRGPHLGGQHSNDGGQRVETTLPADGLFGAAVQRLARLDDQQLGDFVCDLDNALAGARNGTTSDDTDDVAAVAAMARIMHRRRQQAAARARALSIVHTLMSSTETYE